MRLRVRLSTCVFLMAMCLPGVLGRQSPQRTERGCKQRGGIWEPRTKYAGRLEKLYKHCHRYNLLDCFCNDYRTFALKFVVHSYDRKHVCHTTIMNRRLLSKYVEMLPLGQLPPRRCPGSKVGSIPPRSKPVSSFSSSKLSFKVTCRTRTLKTSKGLDGHVVRRQARRRAGKNAESGRIVVNGVDLSACELVPSYAANTITFMQCAAFICAQYLDMPHEQAAVQQACCSHYGLTGHLIDYCWYYPIHSIE